MQIFKKIVILLLINVLVFTILDFIFLYPLNKKNRHGSTSIFEYRENKNISEFDDIFKNAINNIDLSNDNYINFDKYFTVYIFRNDRRFRSSGNISIKGNYDSKESLIKFLDELNVKYDVNQVLNNERIIFFSTNKETFDISLSNMNEIRIGFRVTLPYKYNLSSYDADEYEKYFIDINEKIAKENNKKLFIVNIVVFLILLIINSAIITIDKKYKIINKIKLFD